MVLFPENLKHWRTLRQKSQAELAHTSGISARHLSFLETGKSAPTRDSLEILAKSLRLSVREKQVFFQSAGFTLNHSDFSRDELKPALDLVDKILAAHHPWPALALDENWDVVSTNVSAKKILDLASETLRNKTKNIFRLTLHPEGLSSFIVNLNDWQRNIEMKLEMFPAFTELLKEVRSYRTVTESIQDNSLFIPLILEIDGCRLTFITTTTVFGSPNESTIAGIALETLLPADKETQEFIFSK